MEIGKVVGSVTSVSKIDELKPVKLFIIQLLNSDLKLMDKYVLTNVKTILEIINK